MRQEHNAPTQTCNCNTELRNLILNRIAEKGKITFAEYMDMALYYDDLGYYMSSERKFGKEGDFFTSPCVHPLFGALIAEQVRDMWDLLGQPGGFVIAEFGAGAGFLVHDVLRTIQSSWPEFFATVRYVIVEKSAHLVDLQQRQIMDLALPPGKVEWTSNLPPAWVGCAISNELVDAFPVHRVRQAGHVIREIYVAAQGNSFLEVLDRPSTSEITTYLSRLGVQLVEGQEAEVNLAALGWLKAVAKSMERGFVLTIDYGYESGELYGPRFPQGTLLGYRQHQVATNPYTHIGHQDLTAHVNFSALMRWGEEFGLATTGFTNQMKFLLALGILEKSAALAHSSPSAALRDRLAAKQLFMPGGMGEMFKVLIQHKGVAEPRLTGLRSPW